MSDEVCCDEHEMNENKASHEVKRLIVPDEY